MFAYPFTGFVNHVLSREAWAHERLQPYAGKTLRVRAGLIDFHLCIDSQGLLQATTAATQATDLQLDIPSDAWLGLIQRDEASLRAIRVSGDTELAALIQSLFLNLRWDVEEDLSRVIGDIAAHRIVEGGRAFIGWQKESAQRLGENFAEYWKEEAAMLATRGEVQSFVADAAELRDVVARLEKRIERLGSAPSKPT